ncbi:MAG: LysM peptidoglycan-binding domain-containing protein, partial [Thermomicrobiales bacterium]
MSASSAAGRSGATLSPLIPRFAWSPKYADFPLPFPGSEVSSRAVDVRSAPPSVIGAPTQQIPWQKVLPAAALAVAVLAFAYFALAGNGDGDDDDGQPGIGANGTTTATSVAGSATQRPGEGGAASTATQGSGTTATEAPDGATGAADDTEEAEATDEPAGGEDPEATDMPDDSIVDPASLGIIQVEAAEGETLIDIAAEWGLEVSTLVWANGIEDPGMPLPAGTLVTVPPYDGVIHEVAVGETLESIAAL